MSLFDEIRQELLDLAEPAYRDFSRRLIPDAPSILGTRKPHLHRIAQRLARNDWRTYFYAVSTDSFCEEKMLAALVLRYAHPHSFEEITECIQHYSTLHSSNGQLGSMRHVLRLSAHYIMQSTRIQRIPD